MIRPKGLVSPETCRFRAEELLVTADCKQTIEAANVLRHLAQQWSELADQIEQTFEEPPAIEAKVLVFSAKSADR